MSAINTCTCRVKDFERFHMNTGRVSDPIFHGYFRVDNYEFYFYIHLEWPDILKTIQKGVSYFFA